MASQVSILDFIDPEHPIKVLADQMPWQKVEETFVQYYAPKTPGHKSLRLMSGLLLLKYFHELDNEQLLEYWITNPYFQYFTGETTFHWKSPCEIKELDQLTAKVGEKLPEELLEIPLALLTSQTIEDKMTRKLLDNIDEQLAKKWKEEFEEEFREDSSNKFEEEYGDDFNDEFTEDEFEKDFDEDYQEEDDDDF